MVFSLDHVYFSFKRSSSRNFFIDFFPRNYFRSSKNTFANGPERIFNFRICSESQGLRKFSSKQKKLANLKYLGIFILFYSQSFDCIMATKISLQKKKWKSFLIVCLFVVKSYISRTTSYKYNTKKSLLFVVLQFGCYNDVCEFYYQNKIDYIYTRRWWCGRCFRLNKDLKCHIKNGKPHLPFWWAHTFSVHFVLFQILTISLLKCLYD